MRWALAVAIAVFAHGCAAFIMLPEMAPADPDAGSPAAFIELAPVAVALDSKREDIEPGPPQAEAEKRDQIDARDRQKPDPTPPLPPAPGPDQAQPPPKPAPAETQQQAPQQAPQDESAATAPPEATEHADHAAAPAVGRATQKPSAAELRWERRIAVRLERAKRYPHDASGRSGVAKVMFRIDRDGRLLTSRIVESSGSAALDAATLDLLKRAEPFPKPPRDLSDDRLVFIAPIRYLASASRS
ncbi:energy transducer TonB [Rhodoblastus acidophilus]|uniref:Energy transducer TonB n=1 Tax=Candidatus Rhodoblastus alkanivorans TaxID=2954117 RepID=A0ABS9Z6F3_9HYPH|nr:energy transducer TonB [Candidatus Rhodoblastus alkanivorans]MCI4678590.1 energy transducer TonB [Candidatus Rhodoblastus alkanivorans]MCI4683000.1 energy transducer TonB [Candidatus Rhodoblastus alkanivorans]MDI4640310.1 energy transducer TonB [Rhodoblastus acidophilus]